MDQTPTLPKTQETPKLPKPKSKTKVIILVVVIILAVAALALGGFFVYKKYFAKKGESDKEFLEKTKESLEETDFGEEANEEEFVDETANWQVYKTGDFEIKYPDKDYEEMAKKVEVKTKEAIIKKYEGKTPGPGPEGKLAGDKNLLNKQFEILSRVASEEEISEELQKEIEDNFLLLSEAIDHKYYIDTIFSDNFETAGLNIIGYDSYDAGNISKFYYGTAFLIGDEVILMKWPLYFNSEIEKKRSEFGGTKDMCDENCTKKFEEFAAKVSEEIKNQEFDEALEERIGNYDLMVASLKVFKK